MCSLLHRNTQNIVFLSLCFLVFAIPNFFEVHAVADTTKESYDRLFYYREGKEGRASLKKNYKSIDIFAPQTYSFNEKGELKGSLDPEILKFTKSKKIKVMPLVTNSGFSVKVSKAILNDSQKQTTAINALIKEANKKGYWGWQIDFEQMDSSYKDKFSTFISRAGKEMKKNNLAFSVAVMAHISENPKDYPKNLWQRILGVYDYSALAESVDFVSVMSYDDPESKGPVARYSWLKKVLDYSMAHIPKEKISLGIPLYYWQWKDDSGKLVGIGGNEGIQNVFKKYNVETYYSLTEEAPYLSYFGKSAKYTLWYENAQSIRKKVSLIKENGLHGFSAWALGLEVATIHAAIGK